MKAEFLSSGFRKEDHCLKINTAENMHIQVQHMTRRASTAVRVLYFGTNQTRKFAEVKTA
jgi:hypothetical protein